MFSSFLLQMSVEVGQGKNHFTQRKGNCPLCRERIRRIHYKKKTIEPEYLKMFDELSSSEVGELAPQLRPTMGSRGAVVHPPIFLFPILPVTVLYSMETFSYGVYSS